MLRWDDPVAFIKGATFSVRKAWTALSIATVGDLLTTLPHRYDDFSKIVTIHEARHGDVVTIRGAVLQVKKMPTFRKQLQMIRVLLEDDTGKISATFFNQAWLLHELIIGQSLVLSGKIKIDPVYGKSLLHPLWEISEGETLAVGKVAPVYGLSGTLAQKTYRRLLTLALTEIILPQDPLPDIVRQEQMLLSFADALQALHKPRDMVHAEAGRARFAFDEFLTYQLALQTIKRSSGCMKAPAIPFDPFFAKKFVEHLPYPLTADQKRVTWKILQDMERPLPMRRLLQGDVGSGKTVIAAFVAAHVQRFGASAIFLAPTDILARQHAETLRGFFSTFHIPLLLVTRTDKRAWFDGRMETLTSLQTEERIREGNVVLVGTHALLEARRVPPDLALAIVDEQHRFGVAQRELLARPSRVDGMTPHFLSMTATPIPRSLALTLYGDLEISLIREKPKGRLPIATHVCRGTERERAYAAIREAVKRGERAYLVCPLIDPSDTLGVKSITEEFTRLSTGPLEGIAIGVLHGRIKPIEKETVMQAFAQGNLQVLLATSVIEVGIDITQATVIAIEAAERFGLAQLHQLRGRVGRSSLASRCFLLTDREGPSLDRLRLLEEHQDGLALAEADLVLRGAGNVLGLEQSGGHIFKAARMTDGVLIHAAQKIATDWLDEDSTLAHKPEWQARVLAMQETKHWE